MSPWQTREYRDLNLHVRMKVKIPEVWLDYEVRDIVGYEGGLDGVATFSVGPTTHDETPDPDLAAPMLTGSIKWDGCSHNTFAPAEGGYIHGCSRRDMARLGVLFERMFDQAAELLGAHAAEYLR